MLPIDGFKVRIVEMDSFSFDITRGREILRLDGCDHPSLLGFNLIEADPFLFVYNEKLFLFYESMKYGGRGVINMISTTNLKDWTKPITVLKEKCHLSYPFVFFNEKTNEIFMIPETCQLKEIRLYKGANEDLTDFRYYKTIMRDNVVSTQISFSDSSVFIKDGVYYLHTTRQIENNNVLELYVSSNIDGPYCRHPSSPILKDLKFGRNGGALMTINDKIYRPAQNCAVGYGGDLGIFEVNEISNSNYMETILSDNVLLGKSACYKNGGHHFQRVKFAGKYIISTDAKVQNKYVANRIFDKIKILLRIY